MFTNKQTHLEDKMFFGVGALALTSKAIPMNLLQPPEESQIGTSQLVECFICPIDNCDRQLEDMSKKELIIHLREAHKEDPADYFPLEDPPPDQEAMASTDTLEKRKRTSTSSSRECEQCGEMLPSLVHLHLHVQHIHQKKKKKKKKKKMSKKELKVKCEECGLVLSRSDHLVRHVRNKHPKNGSPRIPQYVPQPTPCPVEGCGQVLSRRDHLNRHIRKIHKADPFDVLSGHHVYAIADDDNGVPRNDDDDEEEKSSSSVATRTTSASLSTTKLATHKKQSGRIILPGRVRQKDPVHQCPVKGCGRWLSTSDHLNHHIKKYHPHNKKKRKNLSGSSDGKLKCPFEGCGTFIVRAEHMRRHIRNVHKADPWTILGGSKKTTTQSGSTSIPRFVCPVEGCAGTFVRSEHLRRHITNVHKADPREVLGGSKTTTQSGSTSTPRFPCPIEGCGKGYARLQNLQRHITDVHKTDPRTVLGGSKKTTTKSSGSTSTPRFVCPFEGCTSESTRSQHLHRHITNVHKADPGKVLGGSNTTADAESGFNKWIGISGLDSTLDSHIKDVQNKNHLEMLDHNNQQQINKEKNEAEPVVLFFDGTSEDVESVDVEMKVFGE